MILRPLLRLSGNLARAREIADKIAYPELRRMKTLMGFQGLSQLVLAPKVLPDGSTYSLRSIFGTDMIIICGAFPALEPGGEVSAALILFLYKDKDNQLAFRIDQDSLQEVQEPMEWTIDQGSTPISLATPNIGFNDFIIRLDSQGARTIGMSPFQYNSNYGGILVVGNKGFYLPEGPVFDANANRSYQVNYQLNGIAGARNQIVTDPNNEGKILKNFKAYIDNVKHQQWTKENPIPCCKIEYDSVDGHHSDFISNPNVDQVFAVMGPGKCFYSERSVSTQEIVNTPVEHIIDWSHYTTAVWSSSDPGDPNPWSSSTGVGHWVPRVVTTNVNVCDKYNVSTKIYFGSVLLLDMVQEVKATGIYSLVDDIPANGGSYPDIASSYEYTNYRTYWYLGAWWDEGYSTLTYANRPNVQYIHELRSNLSGGDLAFDWLDLDYDPENPDETFILFYVTYQKAGWDESTDMTYISDQSSGVGWEYTKPEYRYTRTTLGQKLQCFMQWSCKGGGGKLKLCNDFVQDDYKTMELYTKMVKKGKSANLITGSRAYRYGNYDEDRSQIPYEEWSSDPADGAIQTNQDTHDPWTLKGERIGEVSCFTHTNYLVYSYNKYHWKGNTQDQTRFDWFRGMWNNDPSVWTFLGRTIGAINRETGQVMEKVITDTTYENMDMTAEYAVGVLNKDPQPTPMGG